MESSDPAESIEYCLLGPSGLRGSRTALGTLNFGEGDWALSPPAAKQVFDAFAESGGNLLDTAPSYGHGTALSTLSSLIGGERDRYIIMNKVGVVTSPGDPNSAGLSRKAIEGALRASLRALKTDYIDILVIHAHDPHADIASWCATLANLVVRGDIHEWGVSNVPGWVLSEAATRGAIAGIPMSVAHFEYSVTCRDPELELIPVTRRWNATVMAWSPLNGGILAGRHTDPASTIRRRGFSGRLRVEEEAALEVLTEASEEIGSSPAALAASWVRGKGAIPIVSASSGQQVQDLMTVEHDLMGTPWAESLDRIARPRGHYPQSWLDSVRKDLFGPYSVRAWPRQSTVAE